MSIKLNSTQLVLLRGASEREDRGVVAWTEAKRRQAVRAANQLLEAEFLKEIRAKAQAPVWRRDEESGLSYSLKLTAAGTKAIAHVGCPPVDVAFEEGPVVTGQTRLSAAI